MVQDFAHGYTAPGVYIEEVVTPLASTSGLPPTLVAIVGPAVGYRSGSEQFTLATTPAWRFAKKGLDGATLVITRVDTGAVVVSSDYVVTTTSSPSSSQDYYTDVTRAGGGTLSGDTPVFATYHYAEPTYYDPTRYSSYEDVKDAYGEPLNLTPPSLGQVGYKGVTSPLSLAAKIAFENGSGELILCATTPPGSGATTSGAISTARKTALSAAYAKVATNYAVSIVVPLTDDVIAADAAGVGIDLSTHLTAASADGYFRTGMLGFDAGVGTTPDTLVSGGGFRSKRLSLVYAGSQGMSYYNGGSLQYLSLGHQYLAAALAGRAAALPVQKALTRELVRSFTGLSGTAPSTSAKNQYAAAGVLLTEVDRAGQLVVRHSLTTDTTSINTKELSVVRARDALVALCETGLNNSGLIGQPIDTTTTLTVKSVVSGLLEHAVIVGTIVGYTALAVRQRSIDPSVVEVKFAYQPAYPLNYLVVSFSINVATGTTEDLSATVAA